MPISEANHKSCQDANFVIIGDPVGHCWFTFHQIPKSQCLLKEMSLNLEVILCNAACDVYDMVITFDM